MAQMHPSEPSEKTQSHAEIDLFRKFRDELPDDVHVLHSLGIARHPKKPWAEIDFVVVAGEGVYCLEVKGGVITRRDDVWYTGSHELRESPFSQAGSAGAALFGELSENFNFIRRAVVGSGVMTPDVHFDVTGPDIEPELVYDADDLGQPVSAYLKRISQFWRRKLAAATAHREADFRPLSPGQRETVVEWLAGDFQLVKTLRSSVHRIEHELVRLTREQADLMAGFEDTERVLVKGGAGTGKTLVAVAEARRQAARGATVTFCCFNRSLAAFLREEMREEPKITVTTLHSLMHGLIADAGLEPRLPDAEPQDLMRIFYPELALEALLEGAHVAPDVLIVDELQDLRLNAYVDVFDALLDPGLDGGTWRVFYDPLQALFDAGDPTALERLQAAAPTNYRLTKNCRNTIPVVNQMALMTGIDPQETLRVEGPIPDVEFYDDQKGCTESVFRLLDRWIKDGITEDEIVLLSRRTLSGSCLDPARLHGLKVIEGVGEGGSAIEFHTIRSFKGLDRTAVVLVDIDDVLDPEQRPEIYVGVTRARALLGVVLPESARRGYDERAMSLGQRTAERLAADAVSASGL